MLVSTGQSELFEAGADAPGPEPVPRRRALKHGDTLFASGDARTAAYRIVEGALCHYLVWPSGPHDVIEFVFPGDIVGFGFLADHISTAQAMVDTIVERLDEQQVSDALKDDAELATRLSAAADREMEYVRQRVLGRGARAPLQRVASYLLAVAAHGCRSGEIVVLPQSERDGLALASLLELPPGDLQTALSELEARGLVGPAAGGLVLKDAPALKRLADG